MKAVPLFIAGTKGRALSTVLYGLDETKTADAEGKSSLAALGAIAGEFGAGAAKGYLTKRMLDAVVV